MSLISPILTNTIDRGLDNTKASKALVEINKIVLDFLQN